MFCTYVWRAEVNNTRIVEPQFDIHENKHIIDCCKKVREKFAHLCNVGLMPALADPNKHLAGGRFNSCHR